MRAKNAVLPRTGSVIEAVFREQGAYVDDYDTSRLMISAGLAVMITNNSTANTTSLFPQASRIFHSYGALRCSANQLDIIQTVRYRRIMAVLLNDCDQELDYAQKFLCTLYSMTNGLVEEQRDIHDVLEYASISSTVPEKQEIELADRLVQFLKMECDPARVEIARKTGEIRLTPAGLEWCDARCVKHVWRHNSEISY